MENKISCREMTETDIEQVMIIENACFTDPWAEQSFKATLEERAATLLVLESEENGIVAYSCLYKAVDEGEIVNVAVHPLYRKKGYGAQIVGELMAKGKKMGIVQFFLEVRKSNEAAKKLYHRLGFKECGIRKGFYECPKEDALLMMNILDENCQ